MISFYELYERQEKEIELLTEQLNKCVEALAQHELLKEGDFEYGQRSSKSNSGLIKENE